MFNDDVTSSPAVGVYVKTSILVLTAEITLTPISSTGALFWGIPADFIDFLHI